MNRKMRYLSMLKKADWGFSLPKGSLVNYLKSHVVNRGTRIDFNKTLPTMLSVLATKRCNLKCKFCICKDFPTDWKDYELSVEVFNKIIELRIARKCLVVCFAGGEPLLNQNIGDLVRIARNKNRIVGIISNGILLMEQIDNIIYAGTCDLQVSLYDNTLAKLENILSKTAHRIPINATYVLLKSRLDESEKNEFSNLVNIIKMCKDVGCKSIKFNICEPVNSVTFNETICINDSVYNRFIEVCKKSISDINYEGFNCSNIWLPLNTFTVYFPFPVNKDCNKRTCKIPWNILIVDGKGNYGMCCNHLPDEKYGNLLKDEENTINSIQAQELRIGLKDKKRYTHKSCTTCVHLNNSYISQI